MSRHWIWLLVLLLLGSLGAALWVIQSRPAPEPVVTQITDIVPLHWVEEAQCQSCHSAAFADWQGSHHQLAMQPATAQSVLGDFSGQQVDSDTESHQFLRQDDAFVVRTPGADGQPADFKVAYTFGLEPLQQYLLELPGGRLQAHGMAWDTQQQAWFHLYEGQGVDHQDRLHWTGNQQNANFMCIECHTSDFQRDYDAAGDTFASHWKALGVGCQSCHGPAAEHLDWAEKNSASATPMPKQQEGSMGFAASLAIAPAEEVQVCARCHSRRAPLDDGYQHGNALMDDFLPSILSADLYEVDGKIKEEVFEYGSFKQSKMYIAGVICSDCHNSHSGELRATGNGVCTQCHNGNAQPIRLAIQGSGLQSKNYDSPTHHNHPNGSPGARCINCHMPGKLYMTNDLRHDHSFTSPNPPQALELGHTDACLGCHQQVAAEQIVAQFLAQYPDAEPRDGGYAQDLAAARDGKPGAVAGLLRQLTRDDQPAIRVATLVSELPRYPSLTALQHLANAAQYPDPSVRVAAVNSLPALASEAQLMELLAPLAGDPIRAVRLAVAWQLAQLPPPLRAGLTAWPVLQAEYEQVQNNLLERADAHFNLAMLYQLSGREDQVEGALREALVRDAAFFPAVVMQAQWQEQYLRLPKVGLTLLHKAVKAHPQEPSLHYALGLALVRQGNLADALPAFTQAQQLAPDNPDYTYVLAIALHDSGKPEQARQLLRKQLAADPANRQLRLALVSYLGATAAEAVLLMEQLREQNPDDPAIVRM
ncbi:tetratricopeptide repeat protein [Halopseudomonas pelagia]|uniref:tetratricopeptide repeat protein n=1 Tax=Halopseudomonas pelagia TaxID=553151 RepID=UPI00039C5403|nr:tetratricopeptide repeat protein [Halopseudomonas pelagia]